MGAPSVSVGQARRALTQALKDAGIQSAALESRILIGAALALDPSGLILAQDDQISQTQAALIQGLTARRLSAEPIDHILGYKDFYKSRFIVSKDVLTPRPETETLVEQALLAIQDIKAPSVLELGTGSGAIILSIKDERPDCACTALDISVEALTIARQNAAALNAPCTFIQSDWFSALGDGQFDVIVSNPPYIDAPAMAALDVQVKNYDPDLALFGGLDGLDAYRIIIDQAHRFLRPEGILILEIGFDQRLSVCALLQAGGFTQIKPLPDLSGLDRVITAKPH